MTNFDDLATLFERFAADTDGLYRPWLEEHVPAAGRRAVDLGCGSGRFTGLLADRYQHVLAIDVSAREIDMARAAHPYPNVDYQVRSLLDVTPQDDGRFDLVLSVNTIQHTGPHERILPHIKSLVAPSGHALLVDIVDTSGGRRDQREWHIEHAFRDARDSYLNPRRSGTAQAAADVLLLRLHPLWLDKIARQPRLTREEFHDTYASVFPGAAFANDLHEVACAMHWTNPATRTTTGPPA